MEQQKGLDFGPGAEKPKPQRRPWTVSQLTDRLQGVLETEFFDVWVEGEVSNVTMPASGHWYFSLKDANAQVRAVVWKTAARLIKFKPRDGMKVLVRGAVRVYPPKGEYQIAVEVIEPLGKGSLQQAFEELKAKLEKAGLRAEADLRPEKIGHKIREATLEKTPYMVVLGPKDVEAGTLAVRLRDGTQKFGVTPEDFIRRLTDESASKKTASTWE